MILPTPRSTAPFRLLAVTLISSLAVLGFAGVASAGPTIYVDGTAAAGANDGSSWADAFTNLQDALAEAEAGDEIWVAAGIHRPDRGLTQAPNSRASTFQLKTGVAIYGGFPSGGGDGTFDARDLATNDSVLSGDIGTVGDASDNAYHVVTGSGTGSTAVLDGFTITAGNADGAAAADSVGGGMYNSTGSATLTNCAFEANSASSDGGAIYNLGSDVSFTNCVFQGNSASNQGGAIYNEESDPTLINCSLQGNSAAGDGGAIYNKDSSPSLANSILWNNAAAGVSDTAGASVVDEDDLAVSDPSYSHCLAQNINLSLVGTNNFSGTVDAFNPLFTLEVDPLTAPGAGGDLRLQALSPLIGRGDDAANSTVSDLGGNPRLVPNGIDLGAFEFPQLRFNPNNVTVPVPQGSSYSQSDWLDELNGYTVRFTLKNSTGALAFESFPTVDQDGTLRFHLVAHTAGTASFDVQFIDPSATVADSEVQSITITARSIHYVDASAKGTGDGSSWANAFNHLQDALDAAGGGDEIYVASGTYRPDTTATTDSNDRSATFQLKNSVAIYGGFPKRGSAFDDRDPAIHPTILSGDLLGDDGANFANNGDNAFHVVTGSGRDASALLDGFTITAGNADGGNGGGLLNSGGSPALINCSLRGNSAAKGGAIYNTNSSAPSLINCYLQGNFASDDGGAIYNFNNCNPVLTSCVLQGNSAADDGGAIYNSNFSRPELTNCSLQGNSAAGDGGAVFNSNASSMPFVNCVLWNNAASGVSNTASASVHNFNSLPTYSHCLVQNIDLSAIGTNNFDGSDAGNDPLFAAEVDPLAAPIAGGNLRLLLDASPLIDAGTNSATLPSNFDLAGNSRQQNGTIDIGAFEGFLFREIRTPADMVAAPGQSNAPWLTNELVALGSYFGLLRNDQGTPEGSITAKLTSKGALSGSIRHLGFRLSYRGTIADEGSFAVTATDTRSGRSFDFALQLVSTPEGFRVIGTVSEGGTVLDASLDQSAFHSRKNPAPYAGAYTVLIPADPDNSDGATHPQGAGWGTLKVGTNGKVRLAGQLGDTTRLSLSAVVSEDGTLQIFKELYRSAPKGWIGGTVTFRETPNVSDLDGELFWLKHADAREKLYPAGFDLEPKLIGSEYTRPFIGEPLLPGIDPSRNHNTSWGAGPDIALLSWSEKNKIVATTQPGETLKVAATTSSGAIRGNYQNTASGAKFAFRGIAFQKQDLVAGAFVNVGQGQSDFFTISPAGAPSIEVIDTFVDTTVNNGDTVNFGDSGILSGAIAERNLSIRNNGVSPLLITAITVEAGAPFAVVSQAGQIIEPDGASTVRVQFQPNLAGAATAMITVTSNDADNSPFTLNLTGNGLAGSSADGDRPDSALWAGDTPVTRSLPMTTAVIGTETFDPLAHGGAFQGHVTSPEAGLPIVGFATLRVSDNAFSGTVEIGGVRHRLRGLFDADGAANGTAATGLNFALAVHTVTDARGDSGIKIIGDLDGHAIELVRSGFSTTLPAPFANRYTVVLPHNGRLRDGYPAGDGYGTVLINTRGRVRAALVLGDGTRASISSIVSVDGEWLIYKSLYRTKPKGLLAGTIHFRETTDISDFDGILQWQKHPDLRAKRFGRGFQIRQPMLGSIYAVPAPGERALPGLDDSADNAILFGNSLAVLDPGFALTWDTANKVRYTPVAVERLSVKVNVKSGIVTGSYRDKARGLNLKFGAAIFQIQELATGNYPTASDTGSVTFGRPFVPEP